MIKLLFYTHRSMPCPVIIKDVSSNSKWECVQRPTARKYAERKLVISIRSLPLEVWESHGREGEKYCGSQRGWRTPTKQGSDGLTGTVVANLSPTWSTQSPSCIYYVF